MEEMDHTQIVFYILQGLDLQQQDGQGTVVRRGKKMVRMTLHCFAS